MKTEPLIMKDESQDVVTLTLQLIHELYELKRRYKALEAKNEEHDRKIENLFGQVGDLQMDVGNYERRKTERPIEVWEDDD